MWVQDIPVLIEAPAHCLAYILIRECCAGYMLFYHVVTAVVKVVNARKVARISHIHCICYCLHACLGLVFACFKIVVENIILIVCGNKALYGEPHLLPEKCCGDISEVAAGHAHHEIVSKPLLFHPRISIEVIECLRQKARHVYGVGRRKLHVPVKVFVHKSIFHQCLAVVKDTVYFQCRYIAA